MSRKKWLILSLVLLAGAIGSVLMQVATGFEGSWIMATFWLTIGSFISGLLSFSSPL
jgi:hypothetical protein